MPSNHKPDSQKQPEDLRQYVEYVTPLQKGQSLGPNELESKRGFVVTLSNHPDSLQAVVGRAKEIEQQYLSKQQTQESKQQTQEELPESTDRISIR